MEPGQIRVTWPTERSLATQRSENDRTTDRAVSKRAFAYIPLHIRFVIYEMIVAVTLLL